MQLESIECNGKIAEVAIFDCSLESLLEFLVFDWRVDIDVCQSANYLMIPVLMTIACILPNSSFSLIGLVWLLSFRSSSSSFFIQHSLSDRIICSDSPNTNYSQLWTSSELIRASGFFESVKREGFYWSQKIMHAFCSRKLGLRTIDESNNIWYLEISEYKRVLHTRPILSIPWILLSFSTFFCFFYYFLQIPQYLSETFFFLLTLWFSLQYLF